MTPPPPEERETPVTPVPVIPPSISKRPPPLPAPPRTRSGLHPAVQAHRAKLASIQDGTLGALEKLDQKLDEAIETLKTPLPPAPEEGKEDLDSADDPQTPPPSGEPSDA